MRSSPIPLLGDTKASERRSGWRKRGSRGPWRCARPTGEAPWEWVPASTSHVLSAKRDGGDWTRGGGGMATAAKKSHGAKKWVKDVKTDSTHPSEGLFNKSASTIARELASKEVSPKGPGSGMRTLTYYINRGGKNLSASHKRELEKAKKLLSEKVKAAREKSKE